MCSRSTALRRHPSTSSGQLPSTSAGQAPSTGSGQPVASRSNHAFVLAFRRRAVRGAAPFAVLMALLCGTAVRAHEIGTTRVSVLFREGRTYDIEIVTDAAALVEKLEASAGRSLPADTSPARLQSLLPGLDEARRVRRAAAVARLVIHRIRPYAQSGPRTRPCADRPYKVGAVGVFAARPEMKAAVARPCGDLAHLGEAHESPAMRMSGGGARRHSIAGSRSAE